MAEKSHDRFQLERLAFFSDAVFAIAITLLVIEVRLPELETPTDQALVDALLSLIPQYAGFVVSFFVIGRFWISHHAAFGHLARCDDKLVWRNLLFLLTIAFLPFPTAVIGAYGASKIAVMFYAAWLLFAGLRNRSLLTYALRAGPLIAPGDDPVLRQAHIDRTWSVIIIALLGLAFGAINPFLGLAPLVGSPVILHTVGLLAGRRAKRLTARAVCDQEDSPRGFTRGVSCDSTCWLGGGQHG